MSANLKPKSPLELLGGFFCAWIMVGRVGLEPTTPGLKVWYGPVHQRPLTSIWPQFYHSLFHRSVSRLIDVHPCGCQLLTETTALNRTPSTITTLPAELSVRPGKMAWYCSLSSRAIAAAL